ncbi:OmpP1/FadL family transporter [Chondromyces apiculatus]|uniref:Long-chain fatty acid transport protein n=1 Tax=Chondromyces apiculatus DSM 436 TaxID=1192034 RepID=A0A017TCD9_9BACT|nr:outer membrane protein transport protein [Chondromyces apiculatus]EYF06475.1 Long-chain fatty acid transport protein [Chondromyces apiculatus DSM 436]
MALLRTRSPLARSTVRAVPFAFALLGAALWAEPALASGFSTARFGGEHGNPVTPNATSIYYNPASLGETEGIHIFLDGSLALRSVGWEHTAAASDDVSVPGANTGSNGLFNVIAAPMVGASAKFGDFALGAGFYVPFGGSATWNKNTDFEGDRENAGPYDGVQRWHTISGAIQSMYFTLAAAYKLPFGLSIGVSGNLISSSVTTLRARAADGSNSVSLEGRSLADVSGLQASFGAGLMYEALPDTLWFGASYQARPNITGDVELTGTLTNNFAGTVGESPISFYQGMPDVIRLGGRFKPAKDLELRLFGDFTRWSAMKNQCVADEGTPCEVNEDGSAAEGSSPIVNLPRDWNDAFGIRAGLSYWPTEAAELFAGLGYDSNAVPDETLEPTLSDAHDVSVALGGRFAIGKHVNLAASYTHFFYVQRDTTGLSTLAGLEAPSKSPDAGGIYKQTLGVINVNVDVAF